MTARRTSTSRSRGGDEVAIFIDTGIFVAARNASDKHHDKAVELLARGDYPCRGLVSHLFPLADYRRAFETAFDKRRHQSLKVVLDLRA